VGGGPVQPPSFGLISIIESLTGLDGYPTCYPVLACRPAALLDLAESNMALAYYYVLNEGPQWKVRHSQKDYPYKTEAEALRAAIIAAHQSGKDGHEAQVFVQDGDGKWRAEWTYRYDPYPPKVAPRKHELDRKPAK